MTTDYAAIASEKSLRGLLAFYAIRNNEKVEEEVIAVLEDKKLLATILEWAAGMDVCLAAHRNPDRA